MLCSTGCPAVLHWWQRVIRFGGILNCSDGSLVVSCTTFSVLVALKVSCCTCCLFCSSQPFMVQWLSSSIFPCSRGEQLSFLGAMGWDVFFPREPLASMDFRWFCYPLTITINSFFTNWPLDLMVFQWFWGHSTIVI